jgi:hypothetical protein
MMPENRFESIAGRTILLVANDHFFDALAAPEV